MRIGTHVFIAVFLAITLVDTFPFSGRPLERVRDAIDPVIDVFGIWQGTWDLFAPEVDKENHQIEVRYHLAGSPDPVVWKSPLWIEMGCLERFRNSRHIEFYDRIRSPGNSPAWGSYAWYLKGEFEGESDRVVQKIELASLVERIPPPRDVEPEVASERIPFFELEFTE